MASASIAKVADAYKLDRKTLRTFAPLGALAYDARCLSFNLVGPAVSIWTLEGRQALPFVCGEHRRATLPFQKGEGDLVFRRGEWFLSVTCDMPQAQAQEAIEVLGVDLGIMDIATDSDGEAFSGAHIEMRRQWYAARRQALQKVGTRSAKRLLRKLAGRQQRFQTDTNHRISKRLVAKAERTKRGIALEELTGIRSRARARGPQRRAHTAIGPLGLLHDMSIPCRCSVTSSCCFPKADNGERRRLN